MMIVQSLAEDVDSCKNYRILTSPLSNLNQTVNFFSFFFYIIYSYLVINGLVQYCCGPDEVAPKLSKPAHTDIISS